MTTRIFRDSVNPQLIPLAGTDGVLPYVNGDYAWTDLQIGRFVEARKQVVRIDVNGTAPRKASILDVERYDATPAMAKKWVPQRNAFRLDATLYCGLANLDELFATVTDPFWLIVADWDNNPAQLNIPLPAHVHMAGKQFSSITNQFDVTSVTADGWHPKNHGKWFPLQERLL